MSTYNQMESIAAGDEVYGSDGEKVGTISDVQRDYIVVEKGFFFPTDYYIPVSAIASASAGQVMLNVTKDMALQSDWQTMPEIVSTSTATTVTDDVLLRDQNLTASRTATAGYEVAAEDELSIPVMEEELTATVREQETGSVRIEKRVISEDRVLDVPVTEEQIRVERRVVDRAANAGDARAFEEIVIEVPLTTETVELQKQARVTGEVVVSKEAIEHTERVTGTVRREEVIVGDETVVDSMRTSDIEGGSARG